MSFAKGSERKPVAWEKFLITILITFGAFFLGMLLAASLLNASDSLYDGTSSLRFALNLLPFSIGLAALVLCVKYIHRRSVLSVFTSRSKFDWQRFFFAFGLWFTFQLVFLLLGKASGAPISFNLSLSKILPLLLVSVTLLPIQTVFEDVLYRGYLFQGLSRATGKAGLSVILVALLFGWMHSNNPEVDIFGYFALLYYFISGLFLGILAHLDDGLELGMGYHFANNFFGAVIVTNTWQVFQSNALFLDHSKPQMTWEMWLPLVVLQPAMLYAFYKIYRWKRPLKRMLE